MSRHDSKPSLAYACTGYSNQQPRQPRHAFTLYCQMAMLLLLHDGGIISPAVAPDEELTRGVVAPPERVRSPSSARVVLPLERCVMSDGTALLAIAALAAIEAGETDAAPRYTGPGAAK